MNRAIVGFVLSIAISAAADAQTVEIPFLGSIADLVQQHRLADPRRHPLYSGFELSSSEKKIVMDAMQLLLAKEGATLLRDETLSRVKAGEPLRRIDLTVINTALMYSADQAAQGLRERIYAEIK